MGHRLLRGGRLFVALFVLGVLAPSAPALSGLVPSVLAPRSPDSDRTQLDGLLPVVTPLRPLLPEGSAIVARIPRQIILDPNRKYDMPVTLFSVLPVYDNNGQVAVPTGSVITALLQKRDGGDYLTVKSLVYRGLEVPVQASGRVIPAQIRPESYNQYTVPPKTRASSFFDALVGSNLVSGLTSVLLIDGSSNHASQPKLGSALLGLLGAEALFRGVAVLAERPAAPLPPLVEIPEASVIVVSLSHDLILPRTSSPDTVPVPP